MVHWIGTINNGHIINTLLTFFTALVYIPTPVIIAGHDLRTTRVVASMQFTITSIVIFAKCESIVVAYAVPATSLFDDIFAILAG